MIRDLFCGDELCCKQRSHITFALPRVKGHGSPSQSQFIITIVIALVISYRTAYDMHESSCRVRRGQIRDWVRKLGELLSPCFSLLFTSGSTRRKEGLAACHASNSRLANNHTNHEWLESDVLFSFAASTRARLRPTPRQHDQENDILPSQHGTSSRHRKPTTTVEWDSYGQCYYAQHLGWSIVANL